MARKQGVYSYEEAKRGAATRLRGEEDAIVPPPPPPPTISLYSVESTYVRFNTFASENLKLIGMTRMRRAREVSRPSNRVRKDRQKN